MSILRKVPYTQCFLLLFSTVSWTIALSDRPSEISHNTAQNSFQPQDFPTERLYHAFLVIQRFKNTITRDPKSITATWTGTDICGEGSYLGFYCGTPPGKANKLTVTAVILNGFNLRAPTLQGFIDQLPDLALFHAASNNFGGDIPRLDSVPYWYSLNVGENIKPQASGTVGIYGQGSMGCITTNITFRFDIATDPKKKWGGIIPGGNPRKGWGWSKIPASSTNARALLLNYNGLTGSLPANIGFSKLSYLALASNKLSGSIPPSIGHLQDSLLEVLLLNNQLSGCLPRELGMLTKIVVMDAGMNQLTGPIPSSFSCLSSVEQLNLAGNRLYGDVPDALCELAGPSGRLANLTLSGNYFTSVGPACEVLIKDGVLDVKNNCIPGLSNQRRPAECAAFQSLPKTCPAATTQVTCPAASATNAAASGEIRKARDYSNYVTYATLHE